MSHLHRRAGTRILYQDGVGCQRLVIARVADHNVQAVFLQQTTGPSIVHALYLGYPDTLTVMGIPVESVFHTQCQKHDDNQHRQQVSPQKGTSKLTEEFLYFHLISDFSRAKVRISEQNAK